MRKEIEGMKADLDKKINQTLLANGEPLSSEQDTSLALKVSDTAVVGVHTKAT